METQVMEQETVEETEETRTFTKTRLEEFIDRYYLNGEIEHVVLRVENEVIKCRFVSPDNSIVGEVEMNGVPLDDVEVGIYETSNLKKIFSVLEDDIDIYVQEHGGEPQSLKFVDDFKEAVFRLGDLHIIPSVPNIKHVPDMQIEMELDAQFMDNFQKAAKALKKESNLCAVRTTGRGVEVTVGHSQVGTTNEITLHPDVDEFEQFTDVDEVVFYADKFSEILSANDDVETGTWEISQAGLSKIRFEGDDFSVMYYFVAKQS